MVRGRKMNNNFVWRPIKTGMKVPMTYVIAAIAAVVVVVLLRAWSKKRCPVVAVVNGVQGSGKSTLGTFLEKMGKVHAVDLDIFTQVGYPEDQWKNIGLDVEVMRAMRVRMQEMFTQKMRPSLEWPMWLAQMVRNGEADADDAKKELEIVASFELDLVQSLIREYVRKNMHRGPIVFVGIDDFGGGSVIPPEFLDQRCNRRYFIDLAPKTCRRRVAARYRANNPDDTNFATEALQVYCELYEKLSVQAYAFRTDDPYVLAKRVIEDMKLPFDEQSSAAKEFKAGVDGLREQGLLFMFDSA